MRVTVEDIEKAIDKARDDVDRETAAAESTYGLMESDSIGFIKREIYSKVEEIVKSNPDYTLSIRNRVPELKQKTLKLMSEADAKFHALCRDISAKHRTEDWKYYSGVAELNRDVNDKLQAVLKSLLDPVGNLLFRDFGYTDRSGDWKPNLREEYAYVKAVRLPEELEAVVGDYAASCYRIYELRLEVMKQEKERSIREVEELWNNA